MQTYTNVQNAFPDFDDNIDAMIADLPEGWYDNSWKNDTQPHLECREDGDGLRLWIDYADCRKAEYQEHRADGTIKRFILSDWEGTEWFSTDVWSVMKEYIWANNQMICDYNETDKLVDLE